MMKKDAHLRQSNEDLCMNLQGYNSTDMSHLWPLCYSIHMEDISHYINLLESKYESKND